MITTVKDKHISSNIAPIVSIDCSGLEVSWMPMGHINRQKNQSLKVGRGRLMQATYFWLIIKL